MSVNAGVTNNLLWPNYSKENLDRVKATGSEKKLGQDEFLKILITQLSNQDPMQPMQDKEFIAQMAQFTSLEQLMGISNQLTTLQQSLGMSSTLIGKDISWMELGSTGANGEAGESGVKTGVVDSIVIRSGVAYAKIGEAEIDMANIIEIREPSQSGNGGGAEGSDNPVELPGDAS